jgi:hypothetical protein
VQRAFGGPKPEELDSGLIPPRGFYADLVVRADRGVSCRLSLGHIDYDRRFVVHRSSLDGPPGLARGLRQLGSNQARTATE